MKCQKCGNLATFSYYENINGKEKELILCDKCYKNNNMNNIIEYYFSDDEIDVLCDKCGYEFDKYLKSGKFGCPNCYIKFDNEIDQILKKIHGKNRHMNLNNNKLKVNKALNNEKNNTKDNIADLKSKLERCIKEENYEEAAVIRDKLRSLEK